MFCSHQKPVSIHSTIKCSHVAKVKVLGFFISRLAQFFVFSELPCHPSSYVYLSGPWTMQSICVYLSSLAQQQFAAHWCIVIRHFAKRFRNRRFILLSINWTEVTRAWAAQCFSRPAMHQLSDQHRNPEFDWCINGVTTTGDGESGGGMGRE
jgi:hypothetical protein